ncbi:unnamed protein product [Adineta steineri]|uniref:KH domain-containing protein n=1 Tax=Adineta steineri TaxID=433720 RepID=A0A818WGV5_9BILA|nr:unnamed protein product [Adineta steineri]CAF3725710.1 unnamed protein product [Adineta steineri]
MASDKCIVHSRKNVSKFHTAVNQLHRENRFSNDIHQELPKRCCSCNGNKVLESFKIITATDGCIGHNLKYQSKFNNTINLIRRGKKYKNSIYYELPKRCCSCFNMIDLNVLINICDKYSLDKSSETIKLLFEPETDFQEHKYDVYIHIINGSSNKTFKRNTKFENVAEVRKVINLNELRVLIRRKHPLITTDTISMDEIKQELNAKWKEASEFEFIQKELSFDHNHFQFVCLSFESKLSLHERREIIARFIGKKGENLRNLEDQYNIRLHITNDGTFNRKYIQKIVNEQNENDFCLFITKKNQLITNEISTDEVKERIIQEWKEANIEPYQFLSFLFESEISLQERRRKIGRFIGKKMVNIHVIYKINIIFVYK